MPHSSFPSSVSTTSITPSAPAAPVITSQVGKTILGTGIAGDQFAVVDSAAPNTILLIGTVAGDGTWVADMSSLTAAATLKVKQATLTYSNLSSGFSFTLAIDWADYANLPRVSLPAAGYKVKTTGGVHYLRVQLDKAAWDAPVIFRARLINGNNPGDLHDGDGFTQIDGNFERHFRVDDDNFMDIPVTFKNGTTAGAACIFELMEIRGAANDDGSSMQCTVVVDNTSTLTTAPSPAAVHRAPKKINVSGASPAITLDIANMKMGDQGVVSGFGSSNWRTDLSDGNRTQTGNGEFGFYSDEVLYPSQPACHILESNGAGGTQLRLHTQAVPTPFAVGAVNYNYMASVIAGNNISAWRNRLGLYEVDIVCPDRKAAWWAIWFMTCTSAGVKKWPFEFDGAEGFNHVAVGRWNTGRVSSHAHYGVVGSNVRQGATGIESNLPDMGWTGGFVTTSQHTLGVEFTETEINVYWDHYEYATFRNLFNADMISGSLSWFPLLNVAVGGDSVGDPGAYTGGSPDMILKGMRYYANRTGMTFADAVIPFT